LAWICAWQKSTLGLSTGKGVRRTESRPSLAPRSLEKPRLTVLPRPLL
jgi:hypothetical protein